MKKGSIIIQLLVVVAIIVIANLLSSLLYFRLDFTEDKRYTLSSATKEVLDELEGVVTVTAYFSEDLPPQLLSNRKDFEDMLIEYENRSGGNVVYEFSNPNEGESKEQEVQQKGISPVMINTRENDRVQQMRAYMGATLQMDNGVELIPIIQPGAAMEYDLTTAIKKLSIADKPKVGFITGHGEASLSTMPQLNQQLSILYSVDEYEISGEEEIPSYYRALAWVAPTDTIPDSHLEKLTTYLNSGGKLFVAYSNVTGDLQQGLLSKASDIGLVGWLSQRGLNMGSDFVIDAACATVTVTQQKGFFRMNSQVEFPYFPKISNFGEHPTTKGLDEMTLQFASVVTPAVRDSTASVQTLISTSPNSGIVRPPSYFDVQRKWNKSDFASGSQPVAASVEGIGGFGKLIAIGNGDFVVNGEGQQVRQLLPDHVNFASNAIDWLADDTGLIDLRTKGITSRPLEAIEDATKNMIKYGNVFAPILLLLIYAFFRKLQSQRKRQRWTQGNFE